MQNDLSPVPDMNKPPERAASGQSEQIAEIADAVAELRASAVAQQVAAQATRKLRPFEVVMIVLLAVSLLIHALTITRLLAVRNTLRDEVGRLADSVQGAKSSQLSYNLPINQQIPINVDVPLDRTFSVPINTQVRVKQDLTVPIDTGFGSINIPVPLDTTIPISLTVPIQLNQTINISTTVPINMDVPIQIDMGSSQISGYLDRLYAALQDLRGRL